MMRRLVATAMAVALAVAAGGCSMAQTGKPAGGGGEPASSPAAAPQADAALSDRIAQARADLQQRTGAPITLAHARRVVWSNGSLGCPQPGRAYTQALVDGYEIVFEADGRRWHYHGSDRGEAPRLCPNPSASGGSTPGRVSM